MIVTFEDSATAHSYRKDTGVSWPILIDQERQLYKAYGLGRAALRHLIGPTTLLAYTRELMLGQVPKWPTADPSQQGGDILIDPSGIVRFHHVGAGSGYRPTVEQILAAYQPRSGQDQL